MASKWRLNKAEERQIQEEANQLKAEKLQAGCSEEDAQKAKKEFEKLKEHELKKAKAEKNELRKQQQVQGKVELRKQQQGKVKPGVVPGGNQSQVVPDKSSVNMDYYAKLQDAMQVIQSHKVFKRINEANALQISADEKTSGVQAGKGLTAETAILLLFLFSFVTLTNEAQLSPALLLG